MPKYETIENHIERRTYLQGNFKGKFIGYLDPRKSDIKHEIFYDLEVISGEIKTIKNEHNVRHWETGEPVAFQDTDKFLSNLPDNLPIVITDENGLEKTYNVNLNDTKLSDYELSNQLYVENRVLGDITGQISGYLKHYDIEYIDVEVVSKKLGTSTDNLKVKTKKQTGNIEVKGGYMRWEYYYSDRSTYWGSWIKLTNESNASVSLSDILGFLLQLILVCVFIITLFVFGWKVVLPILVLVGSVYLLSFLSSLISSVFKWFIKLTGTVIILFLIFGIVSAITNSLKYSSVKTTRVFDNVKEVSEISENSVLADSIISHHRIWKDYSNNIYEADLKMRLSNFKESSRLRTNLSIPLNSTTQYNRIVSRIYDNDINRLDLVYITLDSLQTENNFSRTEFAEVIVSLVQDIPYSLILNDACDPNIYNDLFIKEYLNDNGACLGYTKYGLFSPVEFISTLKGDCDTRTLLLFTIFSHYKYDVVMLSSELYKHAIIGINLPYKGMSKLINGKRYIVWETTMQGIPPGLISREISNMRFWNVSLISNKNQEI